MSGVSWDIQVLRAWLMVGQEHPYIGWWFRRTNQCDWRMLMRTFGDHVQKIERFQTFEGTSYRMRRFQDLLEESKEWALPPCKILVRWEKFPSQQEGTWSQLSKVLLRVRGFLGPGKAMVWGCLRPIFLCLSIISSQSWNRSHEKNQRSTAVRVQIFVDLTSNRPDIQQDVLMRLKAGIAWLGEYVAAIDRGKSVKIPLCL